jgi:hypothetical protein
VFIIALRTVLQLNIDMPSESLTTLTNRAAFLMRGDVEHRRTRRQQEKLPPTILEENGYPASYTCKAPGSEGTDADTTTTKTMQIQFDYEFVMKDPREDLVEVFYEDLPILEFGILRKAVQAIGLDTCNLDNQRIKRWRPADGNLQGPGSMIEESHVISLASSRPDEIDPTVGTLRYIPTERSVDDSLLYVPALLPHLLTLPPQTHVFFMIYYPALIVLFIFT